MSKSYGLILPGDGKKSESTQPKADFTRPSIFGSDTDSSDDDNKNKPPPPPSKGAATSRISIGPGNAEKRQARKLQEKALKEDPTVFQYDELYEEMENKRDEEKKAKSKEEKKPRYINRLLEFADRRKIEYERRIERIAQKEREAEGDQFKDKESFVTSSYRKKLEELQKAEEREKREDYLEAIGDVTKQQDLGGFYRHLYEQKLGPKDSNKNNETSTTPPLPPDDEKESEKTDKIKMTKSRAYRKRRASDENEEEIEIHEKNDIATKKAHLQSNLDADSDFSIDSSESEEEPENKNDTNESKQTEDEHIVIKQEPVDNPLSPPGKETNNDEQEKVDNIKTENNDVDRKSEIKQEEKEVKKKKSPKKDIWKKRTVGEVFEAALQRYYERKAARNG